MHFPFKVRQRKRQTGICVMPNKAVNMLKTLNDTEVQKQNKIKVFDSPGYVIDKTEDQSSQQRLVPPSGPFHR